MTSAKLPVVRSDPNTQRQILEATRKVQQMHPHSRTAGMDPVFEEGNATLPIGEYRGQVYSTGPDGTVIMEFIQATPE